MTSHPESKRRLDTEPRPQTQQHTQRKVKLKSKKKLSPVSKQKPKSAIPVKEPQKKVRLAVPWANKGNVSDKYWDIVSRQTESVWGNQIPGRANRPMTVASENQLDRIYTPEEDFELPEFEERVGERGKRGLSQPKSHKFLTKLGGKLAQTEDLFKLEPTEFKDIPGVQGALTNELRIQKQLKKTLTIFTDYNVDDYAKKTIPKTARLVSAKVKSSKEPQRELRPVSSYVKKQQLKHEQKVPRIDIAESRRPMSALPR